MDDAMHQSQSLHQKRDVSEVDVSVVTAIQGRLSLVRTLKSDATISSLLIEKTKPADSGTYECIPSNTGPAKINVHVLDGEYHLSLLSYLYMLHEIWNAGMDNLETFWEFECAGKII